MYLTKNIRLEELIPRQTFNTHGERAVRMLNAGLINATQEIVDHFGLTSIRMNDWLWDGKSEQRGLRVPGQPLYRGLGAHDCGNAIDFIPYRGGEDVQDLIKEIHYDFASEPSGWLYEGIWRVEVITIASTWIHIDAVFNPTQDELVFIDLTNRFTAEEYKEMLT